MKWLISETADFQTLKCHVFVNIDRQHLICVSLWSEQGHWVWYATEYYKSRYTESNFPYSAVRINIFMMAVDT